MLYMYSLTKHYRRFVQQEQVCTAQLQFIWLQEHKLLSIIEQLSLVNLGEYCPMFACQSCYMQPRVSNQTKSNKKLVFNWVHQLNKIEHLLCCEFDFWTSLLAEALFLVFADGRKEISAMGQKWIWFNRHPQSWTALFKMHAPCFVYTHCSTLIPLSFIEPNIVNMTCTSACSKEFNCKELLSLLSVLDNLDDGKIKQMSDQ